MESEELKMNEEEENRDVTQKPAEGADRAHDPYPPHGSYKKMQVTSDTIMGLPGCEVAKRTVRALEKYLDPFTVHVKNRFGKDEGASRCLASDFIENLINTQAVHRPAWGHFRYWMVKALDRYVWDKIKPKASLKKRIARYFADVRDYVVDDLLGFERRQIAKAIELGLVDWFLEKGVGVDGLTAADLRRWKMEVFDELPRREIALIEKVSVTTVGRSVRAVDGYIFTHSREIQALMRDL